MKTPKEDGYSRLAKKKGLRARSAYKLLQLNRKFKIIKKNSDVLDLGCAPGGWMLIAKKLTTGNIVGIDLAPVKPIEGTKIILGDATDPQLIKNLGQFDVVMSDMAPKTTGIKTLDVGRSIDLAFSALDTAKAVLKKDGNFLCKIFQGPGSEDFVKECRKYFKKVFATKPEASKKRSKEFYVVCLRFMKKQKAAA